MEIEVRHTSGAVKKIRTEGRRGNQLELATWLMAGDCLIDLGSGNVLVEVAPIRGGFYQVDLETGRLAASSWRVPMPDLDSLLDLPIGSRVIIEHVRANERDSVEIIDSERSRGIVRVMAKTGRETGRCLHTGWRVTSADLQRLRGGSVKEVA